MASERFSVSEVMRPIKTRSRVYAIANRGLAPDYVAHTVSRFWVLPILGLAIGLLATTLGNHESTLLAVAQGVTLGCLGYLISRLACGRRLFFTRQRWTIDRVALQAIEGFV